MTRREFAATAAAFPFALALDPRALAARLGGVAVGFVTADLESHVVMLDLETAKILARIRTAPGPRSIEAVHRRTAVIAHTEHGVVTLLDTVPRGIRAELEGFRAPRYTAVHPSRQIAYVTDSEREEVVALDTERAVVLSRTSVPGPARHISISPNGETIWAALGTKAARVAVLDSSNPRKPKLAHTLAPPFLAHDVAISPGGMIWVTSGSERALALYHRNRRRPEKVLAAGAPPQHVTFARDKVFVASGDDGTVRRHRLDGTLVREARVPVGSYNVTFGFGHVVTPSLGQGTVSLLDRNGRVREVRRVARAAHDACVLLTP